MGCRKTLPGMIKLKNKVFYRWCSLWFRLSGHSSHLDLKVFLLVCPSIYESRLLQLGVVLVVDGWCPNHLMTCRTICWLHFHYLLAKNKFAYNVGNIILLPDCGVIDLEKLPNPGFFMNSNSVAKKELLFTLTCHFILWLCNIYSNKSIQIK